jgi:hypothetical protein
MADQKRWFKVWTSLLVDMDAQANDVIGAWTRLGCRAALVGASGVVEFDSWAHLARFLNVPDDGAQELMARMRNVSVDEAKTRHGKLTVTFKNWTKYQEDSTQAERARASRAKKRGEEIRREVLPNPETTGANPRPDGLSAPKGKKAAPQNGPVKVGDLIRYPVTEAEVERNRRGKA